MKKGKMKWEQNVSQINQDSFNDHKNINNLILVEN